MTRIVVEVCRDEGEQLHGTVEVEPPGEDGGRAFRGVIELVAAIEAVLEGDDRAER